MKKFEQLVCAAPQIGRIEWIGLRPKYRAPLDAVAEVDAIPGKGLQGDHYAETGGLDRQVTLIQQEHLAVIAAILGRPEISPLLTRRNLVVSGFNLGALKKARFTIGEVVLEATGNCAPCSRMEEVLGPGGYASMIGHGGITAQIISGGVIHVGDSLSILSDSIA